MNTELYEVANNHHTALAGAIRVRVEPAADVTSPMSRDSNPAVLDFSPMALGCAGSRKQEQRLHKPRTVSFKSARWCETDGQ
jgi:hypothetical protein